MRDDIFSNKEGIQQEIEERKKNQQRILDWSKKAKREEIEINPRKKGS